MWIVIIADFIEISQFDLDDHIIKIFDQEDKAYKYAIDWLKDKLKLKDGLDDLDLYEKYGILAQKYRKIDEDYYTHELTYLYDITIYEINIE